MNLLQRLKEIRIRAARCALADAEEFFSACEDANEKYGVYGDLVETARQKVDICRAELARLEDVQ